MPAPPKTIPHIACTFLPILFFNELIPKTNPIAQNKTPIKKRAGASKIAAKNISCFLLIIFFSGRLTQKAYEV